jgi:hypothetical protein
VEHADQEDDLHRARHRREQVRGPGAGDDLAQDRVADHEPETFGDLRPQAGPPGRLTGGRLRARLAIADAQQRRDRDRVGQRVGRHRPGRAERTDQPAAQARARQLRERLGDAELAVAVEQVFLLQQGRQEALVRDVKELWYETSKNTVQTPAVSATA